MNHADTFLYILVGIGTLFITAGILFSLVTFLIDFTRELRLLNSEVRRTRGAEQKYWIQCRRRLWLSLVPFVRY